MRQAKPSLPVAPEPSRDEVHDNTPCLEGGDEGLDPLTVEEKWTGKRTKDISDGSRLKIRVLIHQEPK